MLRLDDDGCRSLLAFSFLRSLPQEDTQEDPVWSNIKADWGRVLTPDILPLNLAHVREQCMPLNPELERQLLKKHIPLFDVTASDASRGGTARSVKETASKVYKRGVYDVKRQVYLFPSRVVFFKNDMCSLWSFYASTAEWAQCHCTWS